MKSDPTMALVFSTSFIIMTLFAVWTPSENLYAQITFPPPIINPPINTLDIIEGDRTHVSNTITAAGNDESPIQSNTVNGDNNILQNCAQTAHGEDNAQSIECEQSGRPDSGLFLPTPQPTPFDN
jgi:hypothetical protein